MEERLKLGVEMMLSKRLKPAPQAKTLSVVGAKRLPSWKQSPNPGAVQQPRSFEYVFAEGEGELALTNEALAQLYVVFGAPGVGKSFFLKRLLAQLSNPEGWAQPWGGLLLDPKQTLLKDVRGTLPEDRIHVIGESAARTMNLLSSHLEPADLGTALALAAQSAGISASDPYWINEMKRLFGDGLALLSLAKLPVTLRELARLFLEATTDPKGRRRTRLSTGFEFLIDRKLDEAGSRKRDAVISGLTEFAESKGDNAQTVRSFIRQILSPFLDPSLDFLSDHTKTDSIGDIVIRDGKWVLLDIPKSRLSVSRFLSTLIKVLFASAALNRYTLYPGNERRIFLFADEYAEIASDLPGEGFGDNYFFSQARQFKVLSFIATQGIPMLENSGVKETWKGILTNSAGKILFRVGDPDTAELASKLMGESDVVMVDHGVSHSGDGANVSVGQKLDRWTQVSSDLFITGLRRGDLVFMGLTDGTGSSSIRFVKVK